MVIRRWQGNEMCIRDSGKGKLSEEDINLALREVRRALLEADVNYKGVKDVVEAIRARATGQQVLESITPSQLIFTIVYEELIKICLLYTSADHRPCLLPLRRDDADARRGDRSRHLLARFTAAAR